METVLRVMKQQRMVWSAAILVGLVLVLVAHAPVIPVIVGCFLALVITALRSISSGAKDGPKPR